MAHSTPRATVYPTAVALVFPYEPALIEAIKRSVPAHARSYSPERREWTVKAPYDRYGLALLRQFFPGAEVVAAGGQRASAPPPRMPLAGERHFAALCVTPAAPPEVVNAAYRAWVKLCHPDALPAPERDGAHRRMTEINGASEALRAEGRA